MSEEWQMPRPDIGDVVLFSKDYRLFNDPSIGFVASKPGDTTISILTFTPTGAAMVYHSCHHKDDPALSSDHGWQDLGVWEFAPLTASIRELMDTGKNGGRKSSK